MCFYFFVDKVLSGLFIIVNCLFGISVKEVIDFDIYYLDVCFFEIYDSSNILCGCFYLDLYVCDCKCGGVWMDDCMGCKVCVNGEL